MKKIIGIMIVLFIICVMCAVHVYCIEPYRSGQKELIHEQNIEIKPYSCPDCNWEFANRKTRRYHKCTEPNDLNELEIQCACGIITKVIGKDISYSQRYSIVTAESNWPEYTEKELDEIYKDEPALGKLAKSLYGYEPNELEYTAKDEPALGRLAKDLCGVGTAWYCSVCKKTYSNEHFCLMPYIPTWPDYIELEKDLVIISPDSTPDDPGENDSWVITFNKGTKIYFK